MAPEHRKRKRRPTVAVITDQAKAEIIRIDTEINEIDTKMREAMFRNLAWYKRTRQDAVARREMARQRFLGKLCANSRIRAERNHRWADPCQIDGMERGVFAERGVVISYFPEDDSQTQPMAQTETQIDNNNPPLEQPHDVYILSDSGSSSSISPPPESPLQSHEDSAPDELVPSPPCRYVSSEPPPHKPARRPLPSSPRRKRTVPSKSLDNAPCMFALITSVLLPLQ